MARRLKAKLKFKGDMIAKAMKLHEGCEALSTMTRQRRCAAWRKTRMAAINKQFGGESRANRRDFALRPVHGRRIEAQ